MTLSRQVKEVSIITAPLIIGVLLYAFLRIERPMFLWWLEPASKPVQHVGFVDWLPDYLWCFSLLAILTLVWEGWKNIPTLWLVFIWIAVMATEFFQYKHWIFGTGDWKDILAYQFAFLTHIFINRKLLQ